MLIDGCHDSITISKLFYDPTTVNDFVLFVVVKYSDVGQPRNSAGTKIVFFHLINDQVTS